MDCVNVINKMTQSGYQQLSSKIVTLYYTRHRWVFTECNGNYIQNKISSVEYIVYDMGKRLNYVQVISIILQCTIFLITNFNAY